MVPAQYMYIPEPMFHRRADTALHTHIFRHLLPGPLPPTPPSVHLRERLPAARPATRGSREIEILVPFRAPAAWRWAVRCSVTSQNVYLPGLLDRVPTGDARLDTEKVRAVRLQLTGAVMAFFNGRSMLFGIE